MTDYIYSVGIDIGTSTTQIVFSKFKIENTASSYAVPRISITEKELVYNSKIYITPLLSETVIDEQGVSRIIKQEYERAGFGPQDITTGAVIITGETARKENAKAVVQIMSGMAGDFVVATAGTELEGIIAGKGAGAGGYSLAKHKTVANIDVGGGTTNIAVFKQGRASDTACLDIGGRLIKFDPRSREVTYIAKKVKQLCEDHNIPIRVGQIADKQDIYHICKLLAKIVGHVLGETKASLQDVNRMITDHALSTGSQPEYMTFSGGVGYCFYNELQEESGFNDIGNILAEALREVFCNIKHKILQPVETLRATVIGAGMYSTEISGSTITYSRDIFPLKTIPIVKVEAEDEKLPLELFAQKVWPMLGWYEADKGQNLAALAIRGVPNISFEEVQNYADKIVRAMEGIIASKYPLVIIVEQDMAKVLGQALQIRLDKTKELVCIDAIDVSGGDYIDIGAPIMNGRVLPVVVKTLIFN